MHCLLCSGKADGVDVAHQLVHAFRAKLHLAVALATYVFAKSDNLFVLFYLTLQLSDGSVRLLVLQAIVEEKHFPLRIVHLTQHLYFSDIILASVERADVPG